MNIGRLITDPDDKGYDTERFPEMSDAEVWLAQLNDDAAHNDGKSLWSRSRQYRCWLAEREEECHDSISDTVHS
jgi:hypothetical protein